MGPRGPPRGAAGWAARLVARDVRLLLEQIAELIDAVGKAVLGEGVDLEGRSAAGPGEGLGLEVDRDLERRGIRDLP